MVKLKHLVEAVPKLRPKLEQVIDELTAHIHSFDIKKSEGFFKKVDSYNFEGFHEEYMQLLTNFFDTLGINITFDYGYYDDHHILKHDFREKPIIGEPAANIGFYYDENKDFEMINLKWGVHFLHSFKDDKNYFNKDYTIDYNDFKKLIECIINEK